MQTAANLQSKAHGAMANETWQMVCWKSAPLVWGDRRAASLSQDLDSPSFHEGWHDPTKYMLDRSTLQAEMNKIIAEDVRKSEANAAARRT